MEMNTKDCLCSVVVVLGAVVALTGCVEEIGSQGKVGKKGPKGDKGEPGAEGILAEAAICSGATQQMYGIDSNGVAMCHEDRTVALEESGLHQLHSMEESIDFTSEDESFQVVANTVERRVSIAMQERDPDFFQSAARQATLDSIAQWDQVYNWGDPRALYLDAEAYQSLPLSSISDADRAKWSEDHARTSEVPDFRVPNIVTVAKEGAQFTSVHEAIKSITDANAENRYLVRVGPGRYAGFAMKEYVDVQGAGAEVTTIYNANPALTHLDSVIWWSNTDVALRDVTIEGSSVPNGDAVGIEVVTNSVLNLENVVIRVSGSSKCWGIASSLGPNLGPSRIGLQGVYIHIDDCSSSNAIGRDSTNQNSVDIRGMNVHIDLHAKKMGGAHGIVATSGILRDVNINVSTQEDGFCTGVLAESGSWEMSRVTVSSGSECQGMGIRVTEGTEPVRLQTIRVNAHGVGLALQRSAQINDAVVEVTTPSHRRGAVSAMSLANGTFSLKRVRVTGAVLSELFSAKISALRLDKDVSSVEIHHSTFALDPNTNGELFAISQGQGGANPAIRIGASQMTGSIDEALDDVRCIHSYNDQLEPIDCL